MLYIKALLAFITHHPTLAYGAIFLISLSESLALVGLIVPGTVIMFGVGAIVATGSLGLANPSCCWPPPEPLPETASATGWATTTRKS